jgi:hypothetical protein
MPSICPVVIDVHIQPPDVPGPLGCSLRKEEVVQGKVNVPSFAPGRIPQDIRQFARTVTTLIPAGLGIETLFAQRYVAFLLRSASMVQMNQMVYGVIDRLQQNGST